MGSTLYARFVLFLQLQRLNSPPSTGVASTKFRDALVFLFSLDLEAGISYQHAMGWTKSTIFVLGSGLLPTAGAPILNKKRGRRKVVLDYESGKHRQARLQGPAGPPSCLSASPAPRPRPPTGSLAHRRVACPIGSGGLPRPVLGRVPQLGRRRLADGFGRPSYSSGPGSPAISLSTSPRPCVCPITAAEPT